MGIFDGFGKFLHDSEKGTYLGTRNASAWRKICCFYLIFYLSLTAFFAICFVGLVSTLPDRGDGPIIQRESPTTEVYAYAHVRTGNPRLFPTSTNENPIKEDDTNNIAFCNSSNCLALALDGPSGVNTFFNEYGVCANTAKSLYEAECGPDYGFNSTTGSGPCFFVRMARVWDHPQNIFQTEIRCFAYGAPAVPTPVMLEPISFEFTQDSVGGTCNASKLLTITNDDGSISGFFEPNPWQNTLDYRQPTVAFKIPSINITYGTPFKIQCNMPNVDQGHLVPGESAGNSIVVA